MTRRLALSILLLGALLGGPLGTSAHAVQPDEMLADPALELRARTISQELRCLVCQNESIDESNADLAHDLRMLVRKRLSAGDSDAQVIRYIVDRYGAFVLLRPPVEPATYLLWFAPALILMLGTAGLIVHFRRRGAAPAEAAPLSDAERRELARLLRREALEGEGIEPRGRS